MGLVFTGKDNNAYDYVTNTLPQDLTPLIRRNGGVAVKVENASGVFEAGVSVSLDGINLADIEKYKSIVFACANEYPGAYISLREVVAGEVVSEWRWKLDKGDVSVKALAFVDLEYVKGEVDLPAFLAKANVAAFVLTEDAAVTKGLTIVAVGFGNMGESYSSIYPISSASTTASSASVRVSSSSRPPNSSASVFFNCSDPSSMSAIDFARICAVSSSSARSSSSNATVRSSSSARSSSSIAASSSSARSSSSVVAPSSGVEQSSSSEGPSFLWRGIGNEGLANRYTVNMNIVPAVEAGHWEFGEYGDKSDVVVPEESPIDTCNGVCGLIRFNETSGIDNPSVELYFAVNTIEHLYYDATALGGLCITYYSDNAATLRIGPSGSATSYEYKIPSYELPAVTGTDKYVSYDIAWESFKQPSGAPKAISGAEAAEKLQFVDIMFKGKDGETQFFNIYEIGSLGQCGKAENIKVSHVDADYFKDMAYQHAQELLNPNSSWYGTYTDQRNKDYTRYYKTIETLNNTWFAQNLNYNTDGSYCYDNKEENCYLYGRLYTWEAAQNACPTGWHLMTDAEFESIRNLFESDEAASLKSTKGWYYGKNGTDNIGFAVTPGGYYDGTSFLEKGKSAYFWVKPSETSNEVRIIQSDVDFVMPDVKEGYYASVRCVKDKPKYENGISAKDLIWYGGNKMNGNASYLTRNLLEEYPYVGSNAKDYIQFGSVTITDDVNITDDIINACGGAVCGTVGNIPAGEATDIYFNVYGNLSVEDWGGICLTYTSTASDGVVLYLETDDATLAKYYIELSKKTNAQSACNAWNNFKQDGKGVKQKLDSYLPKVNAIKIQFNSAASGAKFNIVSVGKYTDGYDYYVSFLAESKANRTSAWDYLSTEPEIKYDTIIDSRDGQVYKTLVLAGKRWMAENLNYAKSGSKCYNDSTKYCNIYGRLYLSSVGNDVCPDGWRLPSYNDFQDVAAAVDGVENAGKLLKSTSGWDDDGNGSNFFGFTALPAGKYVSKYQEMYEEAEFLSIDESTGETMCPYINKSSDKLWGHGCIDGDYVSVRCVKKGDVQYGLLKDDRSGTMQVYKTVKIGDQIWMAENLNYNASGSECNKDCDVFGRLYKPSSVAESDPCPNGWRLPTENDFHILVNEDHDPKALHQTENIGTMLKATSGWNDDGNGTDDFGFSAIAANGAEEVFLAQHEGIYTSYMLLSKRFTTATVGHGSIVSESTKGFPIRCIAQETTGL